MGNKKRYCNPEIIEKVLMGLKRGKSRKEMSLQFGIPVHSIANWDRGHLPARYIKAAKHPSLSALTGVPDNGKPPALPPPPAPPPPTPGQNQTLPPIVPARTPPPPPAPAPQGPPPARYTGPTKEEFAVAFLNEAKRAMDKAEHLAKDLLAANTRIGLIEIEKQNLQVKYDRLLKDHNAYIENNPPRLPADKGEVDDLMRRAHLRPENGG